MPCMVLPTNALHVAAAFVAGPLTLFGPVGAAQAFSWVAPDAASLGAAIDACGRAGEWERAFGLLHAMRRCGQGACLGDGR